MLRADRSLDELDVSVAPLLQSLVEIGHQLEKDRAFGCALVEPKDFGLHVLVGLVRLGEVAILQIFGDLCAALDEEIVEMIDHRPFAEPLLKSVSAREIRLHVGERRLSFVSEHELNFAELHRLKS